MGVGGGAGAATSKQCAGCLAEYLLRGRAAAILHLQHASSRVRGLARHCAVRSGAGAWGQRARGVVSQVVVVVVGLPGAWPQETPSLLMRGKHSTSRSCPELWPLSQS